MGHLVSWCCGNNAQARYMRRFLCCMAGYIATLCLADYYIRRHHPEGLLLYVLAILPAIPILGVIAVTGLCISEEQDEFMRTVMIHSVLWGAGLTLATATVWGFLENFANVIPLQPYLAFPVFWAFVGIARPFVERRYR